MADNLNDLVDALLADPGLKSSLPASEISKGISASKALNDVLLTAITATKSDKDGLIKPKEMEKISAAVFDNPAEWQKFILGHGNDNGTVETGFHHVQNDGGTLVFQGRDFVDTVADAIYHFGFEVIDGRYVNEDGASNETTSDVAGWLNYFLYGVNVVFGGNGANELGSGEYSSYFADARNETFYAYGGNDRIWANLGNDKVYGGDGNDISGGGDGKDWLYGDAGTDTLWGENGNDRLEGGSGSGSDDLGGGNGNDSVYGGAHSDDVSGNDGNDQLFGGDGNDEIYGGNGADVLRGDKGADAFYLWEDFAAADKLVFVAGDSGKNLASIDTVDGFESGSDKINLSSFGKMTFEQLDFRGDGRASCYYDGTYLRIDADGNGATDMMVAFNWTESLKASDFIFG